MVKKRKHPLISYRESKSLRPGDTAAELGISRQSLFRIERGEQNPSMDLIRRIVAMTGGEVSADDLVEAAQ